MTLKLKYEDLANIKIDRVNTVVFNLHQILQSFFGTPRIIEIQALEYDFLYGTAQTKNKRSSGWTKAEFFIYHKVGKLLLACKEHSVADK